jgi:hypothetical protein
MEPMLAITVCASDQNMALGELPDSLPPELARKQALTSRAQRRTGTALQAPRLPQGHHPVGKSLVSTWAAIAQTKSTITLTGAELSYILDVIEVAAEERCRLQKAFLS